VPPSGENAAYEYYALPGDGRGMAEPVAAGYRPRPGSRQPEAAAPRTASREAASVEGLVGGAEVVAPEEEQALETSSVTGSTGVPRTFVAPSVYDLYLYPGDAPSERDRPAMTFDEARQVTVLFGGCTSASPCASAETLTFDGVRWRQRTPSVWPPARHSATLVYDPVRQNTVLFGGYSASGARLSDTWTWDGTTWTQRTPSTSPPPRADAVAAWSPQAGRVVLFGGEGNSGKLADTWTWNGSAWAAGPAGPPARSMSALADTGRSQGLLLYGGAGTSGQREDTWTFNGTGWAQHFPQASPGALERHAAAYDPRLRSLLLTGGWSAADSDYSAAVWSWDGSDWLRGTAGLVIHYPGAHGVAGAGLARSPKDGMVQFGGRIGQGTSSSLAWSTYLFSYLPIGRPPTSSIDDQRLTDRMSAGVNLANAGLVLAATDLSLPGVNGMDLSFTRHYSSLAGSFLSTSVPSHWRYELLDTAAYATPGGSVVITPIDGQQLLFVAGAGGSFTAPADSDMTLTSPSPGTYVLKQRKAQRAWSFGAGGKLVSVADRSGNTITIARDPASLKATSVTDTQGRVVTLGYDPVVGYLDAITDPTGRRTTLSYDYVTGNLAQTQTVAAGGAVLDTTSYTTGYGNVDITHPQGNKTALRLGNMNRAERIVRITNNSTGAGPTRVYNHDFHPDVQVTDPLGRHTTYRAAAEGDSTLTRVGQVTDPLGRVSGTVFDVRGNAVSSTSALGATWTAGYDGLDNRTSLRSPDVPGRGAGSGRVSTWTFNDVNHPHQPDTATDTQGATSTFTYDPAGNRLTASDTTAGPTGGLTVSATYNGPAGTAPTCNGKPGQTCTSTDGRGLTTSYGYNGVGDLISITPPAPAGATTQSHDGLGRVQSRTDGKGQVTGYVYDAADRVLQVRLSGATSCTSAVISAGNCVRFSYDHNGNRTTQTDRHGTLTYGYDALNRVTSRTDPGQSAITSAYDANSNLLSVTEPGGTTGYGYDAANQMVWLAEPGGSCTTTPTTKCTRFGYDDDGNRTTTTYPTSPVTVVTTVPDRSGRPERITAVTGSGTGAVTHSDLSYGYDHVPPGGGAARDGSLVTSRTDHLASSTSGYVTGYGHDTVGQLKHATETDRSGVVVNRWLYSYDRSGNRTSASLTGTPGAAATTFGFNDANQLISRGSTTGFSYDANGNETAAAGSTTRTNATWNNTDQLTAVTVGATSTTMTYLGLDQSDRLTAGGTSFRNGDNGILTATTGSTTTTAIREPDGGLVALRRGTTSFYVLLDNLRSVTGLLNSAGSRVNTYRYDPYGQALPAPTHSGGIDQPYRYTSGHLDTATGLYKLGIRFYDPTLGRFTQIDPTGADPHYTYARNNPINYVDPGGDVAFEIFEAVAGALTNRTVNQVALAQTYARQRAALAAARASQVLRRLGGARGAGGVFPSPCLTQPWLCEDRTAPVNQA